jgi:hypothetical protein
VAPLFLASGALVMTLGGEFSTVLLGRVLMGVGHTRSMLAGITTVLRHPAGPGLGSSLNALEFSSMLGMVSLAVTPLLQTRAPAPLS